MSELMETPDLIILKEINTQVLRNHGNNRKREACSFTSLDEELVPGTGIKDQDPALVAFRELVPRIQKMEEWGLIKRNRKGGIWLTSKGIATLVDES